uniref:alpha-amylase family glycosyl hydrolase n=1 Tax=Paraburkholderia gardini TaxID=2823469 RepID=UPI003898F2BE
MRQRLQRRGLKLMLDFVPNHMAPDHPWIDEHPDYFVHGNEADLARSPQNYCWVESRTGPLLLAHGRDPSAPETNHVHTSLCLTGLSDHITPQYTQPARRKSVCPKA